MTMDYLDRGRLVGEIYNIDNGIEVYLTQANTFLIHWYDYVRPLRLVEV